MSLLRFSAVLVLGAVLVACSDETPSASTSAISLDRADGIVADGTDALKVSVTVHNADGEPVKGVLVALTASGTGNVLSAAATTDENGVARGEVRSTVAEIKTIGANVGPAGQIPLTNTAPARFVAGPAAKLVFVVPPTNAQAGVDLVPPVQVGVQDKDGNIVETSSAEIELSLSANDGGAVLGGTGRMAAAAGVAKFAAILVEKAGTGYSLVAKSEGLPDVVSGTFDISVGPPATLVFETQPVTSVAGEVMPAITVVQHDSLGNVVRTPADVTLALGDAPAGATLAGTLTATTVDGTATFGDLVLEKAGPGFTLAATASSYSGAVSTAFEIRPAVASAEASSFAVAPASLEANGADATTATLLVRDRFQNPVPAQGVSIEVTGSANTLVPADGKGASDETGTFTLTIASTKAEAKTLTAQVADLFTLTRDVTFVPGAPSPDTSTLTADRSSAIADGEEQITFTAKVLDAQGNPVPGRTVSFSSSDETDVFTPSPATGTTDAEGLVTVSAGSTHAAPREVLARVDDAFELKSAVSFLPGAPSPVTSTLASSVSSLVADGVATDTITVTVLDAFSNPVPGQSVTLEASGSANVLLPDPPAGTTGDDGTFTVQLASTKAEAKVITAHVAQAFDLTGEVTFLPGTPSALTSTLVPSLQSLVADGTQKTVLTVTVLDAFSNPVPDHAVSVSSSGTAHTFLPGPDGRTDAAGVFTASLASTRAEVKTITADVGGLFPLTVPVTFLAGPPSSSTSTLTAAPATLTADGVKTSALVLTVLDAFSNPVPGEAVRLRASGTANTTTPAPMDGSTDDGGHFEATIASTKAEVKTITATVAGFDLTTGITFEPGVPSNSTSTLSVSASTVTADGTSRSTLTVAVLDAQGNPVPGHAVRLAASGTGNTLSPAQGQTDASGKVVATLASTRAETKTVTVTIDGFTLTKTLTFVPGAPSSATSTLAITPASLVADGTSAATLTLTVQDAQGNVVPSHAVSLAVSGTGNTLTPANGSTNASGVFSAKVVSTRAEQKTVTATIDAFTLRGTITFVPGAPSSATSTFGASPATLTADGTAKSTLTTTVLDANGNAVSGQAVSVASTGSGNTLSPASGTTSATGVFTTTLASTRAEVKSVTVSIAGFTKTVLVTFVPGAPSSATSGLTASPASVTAGASVSLTITVQDANGNAIAGQAVSLSATGSANAFAPASGSTNASGVFTATLASTKAETKTVTATIGSIVETMLVTFTPGAASSASTTFTASPASLTAGAASTLTATVQDSFGNPISGQAVSFSSTGSGHTLTPASGSTNGSGVITASLASTRAEAKTVTATFGSFTKTATVTFVPGAPHLANSSFAASPGSVTANGTATSSITLVVKDVNGNVISGQAVSLAASGTGHTLTPASGTTNPSGVFTATLAGTKAETKTVTASVGTLSFTATVVFVPGPASSSTSSLVASPTSLTADGASKSTLTVTVRDANGNPIGGQAVSLFSDGSNDTLSATTGSTSASGVFTATLASTAAEVKTLTASIGSFTKTATVTFVPGAPSAGTSSLTASPATLAAGATSTLRVTVKDANGNLIRGQAVSLSATGSANTFTPASGTTDGAGVFAATLTSTKAETKTITATIGGITATASVTFIPGPASSTTSTLAASPISITADGTAKSTLTVTVQDAHGNPIGGQAVSLASSGTAHTLTPASGSTSASGVFTATIASTKAETKTVTATIGGFTETATVTFVPGAPSTATSGVTASPASLTAGASTTLTVTVLDAMGNAIGGQAVSLTASGSANTLSPATGSTNASGVFTATLTSTTAEAKTITATIAGIAETVSVTFNPGPASSTTSTLAASPASLTADGVATSTLTVTVRDAHGNAIGGQAVGLGSTGTAHTLTPASGSTSASGVFTATLASTKAETKTVTATIAGFTKTATVTFVPGAPSTVTSSVTASPASVTAGASTTLTVTVLDAKGNAIGGQAVSLTASGSANTLSPASGTTNASGVFTATLTSTKAEAKTITATIGGMTETVGVTFNAGAASSGNTTFTASPASVTVGASTTLTVTVRDANGNAVGGQAVSLSATGTTHTFTPASGSTNASGVFTATLTSTKAEAKAVTATIGSFSHALTVTFDAGAVSALNSDVAASPTSLYADGAATSTITVTVTDAWGNPLSGKTVTLSNTGAATLTQPAAPTDATGTTTGSIRSSTVGTVTITAVAGGVTLSVQPVVTFTTPYTPGSQTFAYSGSIVNFTVPPAVTSLVVEAWGAQGGGTSGGRGAYVKGTVAVTAGQVLKVLVGGAGVTGGCGSSNGGGGGGSFVWNPSNTTAPLVAAGGGGGYSSNGGGISGPGSATTSGTNSSGGAGNGAAGAIGFGGSGGANTAGSPTYPGTGGGGCGWKGNGAPGTVAAAGGGGISPLNGGNGGAAAPDGYGAAGGFGGGGGSAACSGASGGGGGYTGGGGGNKWNGGAWGSGGGGGSYNAGTSQTNTQGVQAGNGQVKLTW